VSKFTDSYALELIDKITAPMRRIEAQAAKLNATMEKLQGMAEGGAGLLKMVGLLGVAAVGFVSVGKAISGVISLLEYGGKKAWAFGEAVVQATAFREKYLTMLGNRFGDAKGESIYNRVLDASQVTPGRADELMESVGRAANIGLKGRTLSLVTAAGADIQAMFGNESAAKFSRGIADMFSKTKLEEQDWKQALSGIASPEDAAGAILRMKGINVAADKVMATFEKLKKQGKISGKEGVIGALAAVQKNLDNGEGLGSFAVKRGSKSLEGLISNLEEAPANFLRKMKLERLPGMQALMGFLQKLLVFFDVATPQGQRLMRVVEDLVNTLFGGLSKITSQDLDRVFVAATNAARSLVEALQGAWGYMDRLLHDGGGFGGVLSAAGALLVGVGKLLGQGIYQGIRAAMDGKNLLAEMQADAANFSYQKKISEAPAKAEAAAEEMTTQVAVDKSPVLSWIQRQNNHGIQARARMVEVGEDLSEGVEVGARDKSETHSPSRVMAEVGEDLVDGLLEGLQRRVQQLRSGGAAVDGAMDALLEQLRGVALRQGAAAR